MELRGLLLKVRRNRCRSDIGVVFIEAAVTIPLLFMLLFSTYEISRLFDRYHSMAALNREIGNTSRRACSYVADKNTCIADVLAKYEEVISQTMPAAEVYLTIFEYDSANIGLDEVTQSAYAERSVNHTYSSKYSSQTQSLYSFQSQNGVISIGPTNPILIVSELFLPNDNLIIPARFVAGATEIYDVAIF